MKKCPTCDKTFEDSMRFCQVDGTSLVDDAPAFDPYATIVGGQISAATADPAFAEPETAADPEIHYTVGSIPIAEPDDVLDLPSSDPLKTMYVSEAEMQSALSNADIMEIPPIEEASQPAPPSFIVPETAPAYLPEVTPPSFEPTPPPSPFAAESLPVEPAAPVFLDPEPVTPIFDLPAPAFEEPAVPPAAFPDTDHGNFDEAATMIQPSFQSPFEQAPAAWEPTPAPVEQWSPPPAPDASWQNQQIGSNTPFQPPPTGAGGQNKTLAIVSLVAGILGMTVCCGGLIPSIVAIVTGFMARSKAAQNPAEYGGAGLATGGLITGILGLVLGIVLIVLQIVFGVLSNLN